MGNHLLNGITRGRVARAAAAVAVAAVAAVVLDAFRGGVRVWPFGRSTELQPADLAEAQRPYDPAKGLPKPGAAVPEDPPGREARAVEERASRIRRDAAAIVEECQRAAAGDWDRWQKDTAPYRAALLARIERLKRIPGTDDRYADARVEPLEGLKSFPLLEPNAGVHLNYLYDPTQLDAFRHDRPVTAASRWLRRRGIDLIFVPVPKMTEVYADRFLEPCSPDGIIAPHVRQALLELLQDDIEAVDGLTLFRRYRDCDDEYLYNTADPHWAPRGMRVMAKEIASRVERYRFGARARYALPIVRSAPGLYASPDRRPPTEWMEAWQALSPEQKKRAAAVQTTNEAEVRTQDGRPVPDDPRSPVLVVGHSYVPHFREQLVKELNLFVMTHVGLGGTTEFFGDFLRDPTLLEHRRVVVWVTTEQHMTHFLPLPKPILDALGDAK